MKILIISLFFLFQSCLSKNTTTTSFEFKNGWPIIKAELNEKEAWFLLDTGASGFNIVNSQDQEKYKFKFFPIYEVIMGIGGYSYNYYVDSAYLRINNKQLRAIFISQNLDYIFNNYELKTGIRLNGILGSDVFEKHGVIIDYNKRTIIFTK